MRPSKTRILRVLAVVLTAVLAVWPAPEAGACPMCADSLPGQAAPNSDGAATALPNVAQAARDGGAAAGGESSSASAPTPQADLARGFYLSILLMLAVPYAMVLLGGVAVWRLARRRQAQAALRQAGITQAA